MVDKNLNISDELEQCREEAGLFMEQSDEDILVSERPERRDHRLTQLEMSQKHGKIYILDRFMSDTRSSRLSKLGQRTVIKSMQHFFLKVSEVAFCLPLHDSLHQHHTCIDISIFVFYQVGVVEKALAGFRQRLRDNSTPGSRSRVDASGLEGILFSYGITVEKETLDQFIRTCLKDVGREANRSHATGGDASRLVTFDQLVACVPLWRMIGVSGGSIGHIR